jgi:hypothetical protein
MLAWLLFIGLTNIKKFTCYEKYVFLVIMLAMVAGCEKFEPSVDNPVDGWAVLAEKDDHNVEPDLSVDYINIAQMRQALEVSGWNPDQIHDLREFNRGTLQAELDWLEESADENDIVILYVSAHSGYLTGRAGWVFRPEIFADEWAQIPSQRRLLIVDSCFAAKDTKAVASDRHRTCPSLQCPETN